LNNRKSSIRMNFNGFNAVAWQWLKRSSDGLQNHRLGTEKEKDMKRTVSLLTAALFAGALAAPVLAQAPAASPAAPPSMAAPMGGESPTAEASPTGHHRRHHRMHHRRHHAMAPAGEAPSGGEASPAAAPSGQ
jgi:hypothetical protein